MSDLGSTYEQKFKAELPTVTDDGAREHWNSPRQQSVRTNRYACIYPPGTRVLRAEKVVPGAI